MTAYDNAATLTLDVPGAYETALAFAQDLAPEAAQEGEWRAALLATYLRQQGEEDLARMHSVMAVVLARCVAQQLPPNPGPGQPKKECGPESTFSEINRDARKAYRLMLELDDLEFRSYVTEDPRPTKTGAAKLGAKKRKGEPDSVAAHVKLLGDLVAWIRKLKRLEDDPLMPEEMKGVPADLAGRFTELCRYLETFSEQLAQSGWVA